ncbi:MAG: hypothetical protein Q9165_001155 [Trypethelium subeluteriae]
MEPTTVIAPDLPVGARHLGAKSAAMMTTVLPLSVITIEMTTDTPIETCPEVTVTTPTVAMSSAGTKAAVKATKVLLEPRTAVMTMEVPVATTAAITITDMEDVLVVEDIMIMTVRRTMASLTLANMTISETARKAALEVALQSALEQRIFVIVVTNILIGNDIYRITSARMRFTKVVAMTSVQQRHRSNALNLQRTLLSTAAKEKLDKSATEAEEPPLANAETVDEDTLIEQRRRERRRRVEEIKARHAAQIASPMQESKVTTQSAADTPQTESGIPQTRGLSPNVGFVTPPAVAENTGADETTSSDSLPKTPAGSSEVGFRAEAAIQTAEELANLDSVIAGVDGDDEPSAADYDPTADMQADKLRELERRGEGMPAQDYEESETDTEQMLVPQGSIKEPLADHKPQESVKDIDMFAEDDDDDMFAPESDDKPKPGVTQAPKELNANMLDDWDTPDGYYKVILGELLDKRYHVTSKLGAGVFSGVIRAWDTKVENKEVAIKIIRNNESMKKAAFTELNVLNRLKEQDPQDRRHVVRLERSFNHKGHLCMVFESLDVDLRSALKIHGKRSGLSIEAIRHFGRQMFLALLLFKQTDILHADLKPDNILLRDASKIIKICDLGSAVDISDVYANEPRPYLASRFYRAPELILGMKYDFAIDMWSIGCTLFELFTCRILFSGRHNNAMLRSMMECRGRFPQKLLKRASEAHYANNGLVEFPFNDMLDQFYSREEEKLTGREMGKWIPVTRLAERGRDLKSRIFAAVDVKKLKPSEHKELELLHDLLDKCLQLNPDKRLTPDQALQHAFFKNHMISKR